MIWLANSRTICFLLDEISRLEKELKNLIVDAGNKVGVEVEKVKLIYHTKLQEANTETQRLQLVE